jgi:nitroimidazol reductase NimA-like FMN-containing flavoprotein (pyridoxamine 5'-phosphate oxidase superfamily)
MSLQEVHEFLDSKPGWIVLTSIGADGYPHSVPLGYFRLDDDIVMGVRTGTRKLENIRNNPKVSLLLETGASRQDIKGVMIQGMATLHLAPEETLHYAREAARRRGVPEGSYRRSRAKAQPISKYRRGGSALGTIHKGVNSDWKSPRATSPLSIGR